MAECTRGPECKAFGDLTRLQKLQPRDAPPDNRGSRYQACMMEPRETR